MQLLVILSDLEGHFRYSNLSKSVYFWKYCIYISYDVLNTNSRWYIYYILSCRNPAGGLLFKVGRGNIVEMVW